MLDSTVLTRQLSFVGHALCYGAMEWSVTIETCNRIFQVLQQKKRDVFPVYIINMHHFYYLKNVINRSLAAILCGLSFRASDSRATLPHPRGEWYDRSP